MAKNRGDVKCPLVTKEAEIASVGHNLGNQPDS